VAEQLLLDLTVQLLLATEGLAEVVAELPQLRRWLQALLELEVLAAAEVVAVPRSTASGLVLRGLVVMAVLAVAVEEVAAVGTQLGLAVVVGMAL